MYECFVCMYVSTLHACLVSIVAKEGGSPWLQMVVSPMWYPNQTQVFYMSSQCPSPQSHLSRPED